MRRNQIQNFYLKISVANKCQIVQNILIYSVNHVKPALSVNVFYQCMKTDGD